MPHMLGLVFVVIYFPQALFRVVFHATKIEPSNAFREELRERERALVARASAWIVIPPTLEVHLGFLSLQMANTPYGLLIS